MTADNWVCLNTPVNIFQNFLNAVNECFHKLVVAQSSDEKPNSGEICSTVNSTLKHIRRSYIRRIVIPCNYTLTVIILN